MRWLLGIFGGLVGTYGLWQLLGLGLANLGWAVAWMVVVVAAHDLLLAPATLGVGALGSSVLTGPALRVAARWFLIVGTLTVVAIPVLSGRGVRADNPTLLNRNYLGGWLVFALAMLVIVVAAEWLAKVRKDRHGQHLGR